ncbi:MAG: hypothetical protein HYS27_19280 [Deltaproteobacteria bacterium]|nr:hypothetical protein [Deltaproteobacteria bacterium]
MIVPTRPLWLLGRDLSQSPSPLLHNAALAALGAPPLYALHAVEPADVERAFDDAEHTCRGSNVTAPYKLRAAERWRAVLDDTARAVGAVNTVVFERDRAVSAHNTDVRGLLTAWRRASVDVTGRVVAVLGAGGAARAAVVAAGEAKARAVALSARRTDAADALATLARARGLAVVDEPAQLVVLAASALEDPGAAIARALRGPGSVHELRYGAAARTSRDAALKAGHVFLDGTSMLLAQAQAALALFLGGTLPDHASAAMAAAVSAWLKRT